MSRRYEAVCLSEEHATAVVTDFELSAPQVTVSAFIGYHYCDWDEGLLTLV